MLPERFQFIIKLNPFQQMIQLVRAPLLGELPSLNSYAYSVGLFGVGLTLMIFLLIRGRHRIAFWI